MNGCGTCDADGKCLSCQDDFYLTSDGQCVDSCPRSYFVEVDEDTGFASCKKCPNNCVDCDSATTCNQCIDAYALVSSIKPALSDEEFQDAVAVNRPCRSQLQCPDKVSFYYDGKCQSCEAGCLECHKNLGCRVPCSDTCGDCFGSAENCIACKEGDKLMKLANGTSTCKPDCDEGQWYDAEAKECVDCMDGCASCNNATTCLQCSEDLFYLGASADKNETDSCLRSCPAGYFDNDDGECEKCTAGCDVCSSATRCRACNDFTALSNGKCLCEFNYEIRARPTFHYIRIDFSYINWEINATNITSGDKFDCDEIFDFDYASSVDFNLEDLRCYGSEIESDGGVKQRITIRSNDEEQLNLLVNQDVQIKLKEDVFSQECTLPKNGLDTTLEFPVSSSSCHTCGALHGDL